VQNELDEEEPLDWSLFVQAYAAGKWDPRHTPKPPGSQRFPNVAFTEVGRVEEVSRTSGFLRSATSTSDDTLVLRRRVPGTSSSSSLSSKLSLGTPGSGSDSGSGSTAASSLALVSYSPPAIVPAHAMSLKMRREQSQHGGESYSGSNTPSQPFPKLTMPLPAPRGILSRSLSDSSTTVSPAPIDDSSRSSAHESHHDFHAAAAAMRLAGDGIDVRPLALPSPEVELTDPLRGHTASIALPWSREGQDPSGDSAMFSVTSSDSGSHSRKTRLNSFWNVVLDDVMGCPAEANTGANAAMEERDHPSSLPTISASPVGTPAQTMGSSRRLSLKDHASPKHIPPVSAPLLVGLPKPSPNDYFAIPPRRREDTSRLTEASLCPTTSDESPSLPIMQDISVFEASPQSLPSSRGSRRPPLFSRAVSEPLTPRTKAPDGSPLDPASDHEPPCPRPQSELIKPSHRKVREEVEYHRRGFLIPPTPPNEWERQKALYKSVWVF
jgi:hypothetical protein